MTEKDKKNPYTDMPQDVLDTHLEQLSVVVKDKKVDVTQYFSTSISKEDQDKIDQADTQTAKIKELTDAVSSKDLSDNEKILSQASIDRIVSDIRNIDTDAPLASVLESKFNNLDKLSILGGVQRIVEHYAGQIATIKKEVGSGTKTGTQTFGKAKDAGSAEDIIKELYKIKET